MTAQAMRLTKHKRQIMANGKPLDASSAAELFGLVESLLRTMDETGTFELDFQGEFCGGTIGLAAGRHRFDTVFDDGSDK